MSVQLTTTEATEQAMESKSITNTKSQSKSALRAASNPKSAPVPIQPPQKAAGMERPRSAYNDWH